MRKFITGVLLLVISCVPALASAEITRPSQVVANVVPSNSLAQAESRDVAPGSTQDYATREAAAPQLAAFAGGGGGIYIGTGALVVALLVVIVVLVVR
jgi:hypothetical protein